MSNKAHRLTHKRYSDGNETTLSYTPASRLDKSSVFKVCGFDPEKGAEVPMPIPLDAMRSAIADRPDLLELLEQRVKALESIISMDFETSLLHVAALYLRSERHGSRYLNEVCPCYDYVTLIEHHPHRSFRASNGMMSTLQMPLYLTWNHAMSHRKSLHCIFVQLANVDLNDHTSQWHDLWVPDTLAHLITLAIVDFSRRAVIEPAVQFVLDALRIFIFCCEAPDLQVHGAMTKGKHTSSHDMLFPCMFPLMKKFVRNFINHHHGRTRDKIPDLGDLLQWLAVVELMDSKSLDSSDCIKWEDLVPAFIVELFRRQARWVCKHFTQSRKNRGKRGHAKTDIVLNCAARLPQKTLLKIWWEQSQVSCRVVMYSYAFYVKLIKGQTLNTFNNKYDCVLGAVYPEDLAAIKQAETEILCQNSLSGMLRFLNYPQSEDDIHRLLLWAIQANEGYQCAPLPPRMNSLKAKKPIATRPVAAFAATKGAPPPTARGVHTTPRSWVEVTKAYQSNPLGANHHVEQIPRPVTSMGTAQEEERETVYTRRTWADVARL